MSQIRVATIGTSMITGLFLEGVADTPGIEFIGAYSRSLDKAKEYTEAHGGRKSWDDLEAMCADPEVDAVYVASPNLLHLPQALQAIGHGKHVLVEKPAGINVAQTRELFAAAAEKGVVAMEAMRSVHDPAYAVIKENLSKLGPVRRFTLTYAKYSSRYDLVLAGEHTNIFDPNLATGAMMDLGVYPINCMVYLFGAPDDVACFADTVSVGEDDLIDVAGTALCDYDGCVGTVAYSKCTTDKLGCEVEGEIATMTYDGVSGPSNIRIHYRDERGVVDVPVDAQYASDPEVANMKFEVADFVAMINGDMDPRPFMDITITAREIMDTMRFKAGVVFPGDEVETQ